jgi:hypothetical protein
MAKIRGGGFGTTLAWALVLVVLALAAGIGLARYGDRVPWLANLMGEPTQTTESVVLGVQRLNELATAEMTAQVIVTEEQEDAHIFFQRVPGFLVGEKVLLVVRGEVEAGIDLDELGEDDVRVVEKKVTIDLPEARLLDTTLNEEKTRLYVLERGVLTRGDYSLVEEARRDAIDEIEEAARDEDLVDKAQNNAEDRIREFLISLGYEEVVFT